MATKLPTKEMLKVHLDIFNGHNYATKAGAEVWLSWRPVQNGRGYQSAAWQVMRLDGKPTNPGGHWRDYGHKTFDVYGRDEKQNSLEQAQAWVESEYGISEWERTPYGDYVPAGSKDIILAKYKAATS